MSGPNVLNMLRRASFPRNLAIPQLLRSNVLAILPLVMRDLTTVLTHRRLSPHQSTPMLLGAHWVQATPRFAFCLSLSQCPGAPQQGCSMSNNR
jgi:hypothetical protein